MELLNNDNDDMFLQELQQRDLASHRPHLTAHGIHHVSEQTPQPLAQSVSTAPCETSIENVELPAFNNTCPFLWLRLVESAFRRNRITNPWDKYDLVMAHLPCEALGAVKDIMTTPEDTTADAYSRLSERLLVAFGKSPFQLANELHEHRGLGEGPPSELMNSLLELLPPGEPPGAIFISFFLRRLPFLHTCTTGQPAL
jgi:hypothetical protein